MEAPAPPPYEHFSAKELRRQRQFAVFYIVWVAAITVLLWAGTYGAVHSVFPWTAPERMLVSAGVLVNLTLLHSIVYTITLFWGNYPASVPG